MNQSVQFDLKNLVIPEVIFLKKVCDLVEENHCLSKNAALNGYGITGLARDYLNKYDLDLQCAYVNILTAYKETSLKDEKEIGWLVNEARGPRFSFAETPLQLAKEILYEVYLVEKYSPSTQKMPIFKDLQNKYIQIADEYTKNFEELSPQMKLLHTIMELEALNSVILPNFGKNPHSFETTTNFLLHAYVPEKLNYEYAFCADPVTSAELFNTLFEEFQNIFKKFAKDDSEHKNHVETVADRDFIRKIFTIKNIADDFLAQETSPSMNS